MCFKTLIIFGLFAVALGFSLPEKNTSNVESEWVFGDVVPVSDDLVLVRNARSPEVSEDEEMMKKKQNITKNLEDFAEVSKNGKSGQVVLTNKMPASSVSGSVGYSLSEGSSATIGYNHQITPNMGASAEASRNFKSNENSGQAGLTYKMPDSSLSGSVTHSTSDGPSAKIGYNHQITPNLGASAEASRNFKSNENSGQVGLTYKMPDSSLSGSVAYSTSNGPSATIAYRQTITSNLDEFDKALRNIRFNENRGHAGLTYRMPQSSLADTPFPMASLFNYNPQITPKFDVLNGAPTNFRFNPNRGNIGLRYWPSW